MKCLGILSMFTKGTETQNHKDITNGYFFPSQKDLKGRCLALPFKKNLFVPKYSLFNQQAAPSPARVLEVG